MAHVSLNGPSASWGKIFDDPVVAEFIFLRETKMGL
jgi:hypothetical protein